jgi:hypothetical protein
MNIRSGITVVILLCATLTFAQAPSVYSKLGVGTVENTPTPSSLGLNMTGVALNDGDFISSVNPASFGSINLTRLAINMEFNGDFVRNAEMSKYYAKGTFSGFAIAVPVYTAWGIGTAFGLTPFSKTNYDVKFTDASNVQLGPYTTEFSATGGLNKLFFGASYNLPGDIKIGATYNYYFGSYTYNSNVSFTNGATTGKYVTEYQEKGPGTTIGLFTPDIAPLFGSSTLKNIRFAGSLELFKTLHTDSSFARQTTYLYDTLITGTGNTKIPKRILAGMSMQVADNYNFYLEYMNQDWTGFKHVGVYEPALKNSDRYALGFEYRPKKGNSFDYNKILIRGGLSYENLPYHLNNTDINQYSISAGISYPVGPQNYIDVGLAFCVRGTTDNSLIQDRLVKLSIGMNFGELWFVPEEH